MRTIRDVIAVSLALMLMIGCGSRSVKTAKTTEETHKKEEIKTQVEAVEKTEVESQKEVATIQVQEVVQESQKQATENEVRQKAKVKKKTTYYPNGQVKSQTESTETENETIAKQRLEIDYLQSSVVALREEVETLTQENNKITQENKQLLSETEQLKKEKDKDAEREAYAWNWWVFGGIIVWEVGKFLVKQTYRRFFSKRE